MRKTLTALAIVLSAPAFAQQQPSTVTNMPFASTPLDGSELLYLVQKGNPRKTTASSLIALLNSTLFSSTTPFTAIGNGATNTTTVAGQSGETIDVVAHFGAKGDANQCSDAVFSAGVNTISSQCANWSVANIGEAIIVGGAGTNGAPLVSTITGVSDAHDATLSSTPAYPSTYSRLYMVYPTTPQSGGGSYVPGDTITLAGGTAVIAATVKVAETLVQSATVNAGGSGGTTAAGAATGACEVYGTTGSGDKARLNVTITAGAITAVNSVDFVGRYVTNPTTLTAEPVTGCSGITGATLSVVMGVRVGVTTGAQGVYSATAATLTQASTSGSGTGAVFTAGWASDALFSYGFDNTTAFKAAQAAAAAAFAAGTPATIHIPTGHFLIGSALSTMSRGVSVAGDESLSSVLVTPEGFTGSLLQWSDAWFGLNFPQQNGSVVNLGTIAFGPHLRNLSIAGDVTSPTEWTAIDFRDWNDYVLIENIHAWDVNGPMLSAGHTLNAASAAMRESAIFNLRGDQVGAPDTPAVELTGTGAATNGTDEVGVHELSMFGVRGRGLVVSNIASVGAAYNINFYDLRVEGYASTVAVPARSGDLIVIGDATASGPTYHVNLYGFRTASSPPNSAALRISAAGSSTAPSGIYAHGLIGSTGYPNADGLSIDAGYNLTIGLEAVTVTGNKLIVGPSPLTAPAIQLNADQNLLDTLNGFFDPSAAPYFATPVVKYGSPFAASYSMSAGYHNSTNAFGNPIGSNALELMMNRQLAAQGATGSGATAVGGVYNTVAGNGSTVAGGNSNVLSGSRNFASGFQTNDHGDGGVALYGDGDVTATGDTQTSTVHLYASGTSNPLTVAAFGSGTLNTSNCVNLPANYSFGGPMSLLASDVTTHGTVYIWNGLILMNKDATAASTVANVIGTPVIGTVGTTTGASVAVSADTTGTTNGCLKVVFTKPTASASDNYTVTVGINGVWAAQ